MKTTFKLVLSVLAVGLFMNGCAQKIKIQALHPAEVGAMATQKKVAINSFKNDSVGLSGKIESKIAQHKLDGRTYFTVLSRKDLDKIMAEQHLQSSELMDEATTTRIGKLIGAQAIVSGEIIASNTHYSSYQKQEKECLSYTKKGVCEKWRYYNVTCKTMRTSLSANINILNVETGTLIYGDTLNKEYSGDSCDDTILSQVQALNRLSTSIADNFVHKLTPHYIYFEVTLLDEIELKSATKQQKEAFKYALEYLESNRFDKAQQILERLLDELDAKSYAVVYVYGVVQEAQGKLKEAQKMYLLADSLTLRPVVEIDTAIVRIQSSIQKNKQAIEQINAK